MKAIMAGQRIPLRNKIESAVAIYRAHRRGEFSSAARDIAYHSQLVDWFDRHVGIPLPQGRILDLGCGQNATQTALFHADGAHVTGIDAEVPTHLMGWGTFVRVLERNGSERAIKSLVRHLLFDGKHFSDLEKAYRCNITLNDLDVRTMDATGMDFEDSTFDFVFSMAVFEHIDDPRAAARELNRILKAKGIGVITPHLFPSLSGGHCLEWMWPDEKASENVPPWDHLRENRHPPDTYLNRLRLNDYRNLFQTECDIVDEEAVIEGANYLTPELESELGAKGYPREDLLTRAVTFFVRKKR